MRFSSQKFAGRFDCHQQIKDSVKIPLSASKENNYLKCFYNSQIELTASLLCFAYLTGSESHFSFSFSKPLRLTGVSGKERSWHGNKKVLPQVTGQDWHSSPCDNSEIQMSFILQPCNREHAGSKVTTAGRYKEEVAYGLYILQGVHSHFIGQNQHSQGRLGSVHGQQVGANHF